jgi:hypothetical protein|tara:strand:- start:26 stop:694 length:669 start_codon:yes stop_codon:yes gene_type:complete
MHFPTLIVDNFFDDTQKVLQVSEQLEFKDLPHKRWAGLRTDKMHEVNPSFFDYVSKKITRLMFPSDYNNMIWHVEMYFSKTNPKDLKHPDWVHKDEAAEFTSIIYLSDHSCGTDICHLKNTFDSVPDSFGNEQFKYYRDTSAKEPKTKKDLDFKFEDTINVKGRLNRMIVFDGNSWHRQQKFSEQDTQLKQDRLTLISFFHQISTVPNTNRTNFPMTEMRRL